MRFTDFLKATVLISAGAATALAAVSVTAASSQGETELALIGVGWWLLAALYGTYLGRRSHASPAIARLLAGARTSPALPELQPGRILVNRLWPLLLSMLVAGALAFLAPQIPAIATGLRDHLGAGLAPSGEGGGAIEDRDGVRFYVERTSPIQPIKLLRTPGFTSIFPSPNGSGKPDAALRPASPTRCSASGSERRPQSPSGSGAPHSV